MLKEGRSLGEVVLLDTKNTGDFALAPKAVQESLASLEGSLPLVVIASADGSKVYGSYHLGLLRAQNLTSVFREAKKALRADAKSSSPGRNGRVASTERDQAQAKSADGAAEDEGAPYQWWTSTHGTRIEARLERAGSDSVTLRARNGRAITIEKHQLDAASLAQAEEGR